MHRTDSGQPQKDSVSSDLHAHPPPTSSSLPPPPLGFRFVAFGLGGIVAIAVNRKEAHRVEIHRDAGEMRPLQYWVKLGPQALL